MTIYIGSDHAGYELKELVKKHFEGHFEFADQGTFSSESVDYPDFAHAVADRVLKDKDGVGILICGTGNGMAITANKHAGIRAALCWDPAISALAKQHNNANILVLPARFVSYAMANACVRTWLATPFAGGRHQRRIDKIEA